jgi:hypothetical protein
MDSSSNQRCKKLHAQECKRQFSSSVQWKWNTSFIIRNFIQFLHAKSKYTEIRRGRGHVEGSGNIKYFNVLSQTLHGELTKVSIEYNTLYATDEVLLTYQEMTK